MTLPWMTRSGRFAPLKAGTLALCLLPGLVIAFWYIHGDLGALPTKAALHLLGLWSIRFLLVTLALTPLQRLLVWPQLAQIRRMVGTTAAVYAGLHLALFLPFMDYSGNKIATEILQRPYLTIGAIAFALLMVLAFTSTDRQISRLGPRWKPLHRMIYAIVPLVLLHMALQEKIDATPALQLAGLFILLMVVRAALALRLPATAAMLGVATVITAVGTGALEALWYASLTGINASRVIAANWVLTEGLRPAQLVLGLGLLAAAMVQVRHLRRPKPAVIAR